MRPPAWLTRAGLEDLSAKAREGARRRLNRNLHEADEPVHRLLNAIEPGSWVQPHRHLDPPRTETLVVVAGALGLAVYDDEGRVTDLARLEPRGETFGVDLAPGTWHSLVALEPGTVFFETKPGPYVPPAAADRASWAPAEGDATAAAAEAKLRALFLHARG